MLSIRVLSEEREEVFASALSVVEKTEKLEAQKFGSLRGPNIRNSDLSLMRGPNFCLFVCSIIIGDLFQNLGKYLTMRDNRHKFIEEIESRFLYPSFIISNVVYNM